MYSDGFKLIGNAAIFIIAILIKFSSVFILILNCVNFLYVVFIVLSSNKLMINIYPLFIININAHNANLFVYLTYIHHIKKHYWYMLVLDK